MAGACLAEYFYRENYNLWHIGPTDRSAYLYNLTGTEKLQFEATNFNTTGGTHYLTNQYWEIFLPQISDNLLKFHVIVLLSLQSIYIALQWKRNSSLHLQYKSILGDYIFFFRSYIYNHDILFILVENKRSSTRIVN